MGMLEEGLGKERRGGYCVPNGFSLSLGTIRTIYSLEWLWQSAVVF